MPEWKSFTFGDDGEAVPEAMPAPAAPSPAMEADEYAAKWGTEVSEVSIARIENVLEGDGLPHGSNEFIAVTQLEDVQFQWNSAHLQPTVFPIEGGDGWALMAASRFFVGEGLSDRQIHAMLRRGLIIGLSAAQELPGLLAESAK